MSSLQTYDFSVARVRFALSAFQRSSGRFVLSGALAPRARPNRGGQRGVSSQHALSPRPVVGTAIPAASRGFVRRLVQPDVRPADKRFFVTGSPDAGGGRLGFRTSFPFCRTPHAFAGVAALSHSLWSLRQRVTGFVQF